MDRFLWSQTEVPSEVTARAISVCLYDGDVESAFKSGTLEVTPLELLWTDDCDRLCKLELPLSLVISHDRHSKSFTKSAKIVLHLASCPAELQGQGPSNVNYSSFVKLSFRRGGEDQIFNAIVKALSNRAWEKQSRQLIGKSSRSVGIAGIERNLRDGFSKTSGDINQAFEDLTKLINSAKEMVKLSKSISDKIRSKHGLITDDETVQFKSYLLSMGVEDPVTKDSFGNVSEYYKGLAHEISRVLHQPLKEAGGAMSLADAYCRINRARGLELISPDDMVHACKLLKSLGLPVRLHTFDTGVMILQLSEVSVEKDAQKTLSVISQQKSVTADELSALTSIPMLLAKQKLLHAESLGLLCRDETIEGLKFYPNFFVHPPELK